MDIIYICFHNTQKTKRSRKAIWISEENITFDNISEFNTPYVFEIRPCSAAEIDYWIMYSEIRWLCFPLIRILPLLLSKLIYNYLIRLRCILWFCFNPYTRNCVYMHRVDSMLIHINVWNLNWNTCAILKHCANCIVKAIWSASVSKSLIRFPGSF